MEAEERTQILASLVRTKVKQLYREIDDLRRLTAELDSLCRTETTTEETRNGN